jgi:ABC-type branched-subunit amino acid transport system substrate-binding protein
VKHRRPHRGSNPSLGAARALAAAAALALPIALASCGGSGAGPDHLVIGDLVPLRGDLAAYGPGGRKAVDLAVREARSAARDSGDPLTVTVRHEDTETSDAIAENAARHLVDDSDASCLVGDWTTSGTFAVGEDVAASRSVPLISPSATNPEISSLDDGGFVFRTAPSDDLQARALAVLVARSLGGARGRTVAVAGRDDVYGPRFAGHFAQAWRQMGGEVSGPILYDAGKLHHRAEARRIVAGHPDAYLIVDFPDSFARLAPDLLRAPGFDPRRLFLPAAMAVPDVRERGIPAAAVDGARGVLPGAVAPTPEGRFFRRLYRQSPTGPPSPMAFDAQAFDAATLCYLAAVAANSSGGGEIASRIRDVASPPGRRVGPGDLATAVRLLRRGVGIDYQGASGPLELDAAGDPGAGAYRVFVYRLGKMRATATFDVKD